MTGMTDVQISALPLDRLADLLSLDAAEQLRDTGARAQVLLAGRAVWNVNSTASGGGVAEMLVTLLAYGRGVSVDTRWTVIEGDPDFFAITKRLHNALHGSAGDGGDLGAKEHDHYRAVTARNLAQLKPRIRPDDIVLLHDPQTAGLAEGLLDTGAHVLWRCHIGADTSSAVTDAGWAFLRPYVEVAQGFIFTRSQYAPPWIPRERLHVIPPSIDPYAVKNRPLVRKDVARILRLASVMDGGPPADPVSYVGRDGSTHTMRQHAGLLQGTPPLDQNTRTVVQVSRWDRLKDMPGVMTAFVEHVAPVHDDVHLLLVGPAVEGVADDPEGAEVLAECTEQWAALPDAVRGRVHLVCVPMSDLDENALIVNALQRWATVVVQKSIAEGFGLTVTEAMWKARPVVASAVGGIPDQIVDGRDGLLVPARDLDAAGGAMNRALGDAALAARLGENAMARVREDFLGGRHLTQYVNLFELLRHA